MIALLVYQAVFSDGVTINQTVPATAKAGSEFTVELKISKGSIGGFAKLQQELPEGFTATAIENSGGSFTFANKSVKIIWASLPSQTEFKVSYKVTVDAAMSGAQTIAGKFSYVDAANQKQNTGIDASVIDITTEEVAVKEEPKKEAKEETKTETTTANTTASDTAKTASTTNTETVADIKKEEESKVLPVQEITSTRTMPSEAMGEFKVEITLNKGNVSGYCKLQETLPEGFTAKAIDKANSEFTFVNGVVKFVWVSISAKKEQLKVSYKVTLDPTVNGSKTIEGLFSYIENDATKKHVLENGSISIKGKETEPVLAINETKVDTSNNTTTTQNTTGTTTNETTGTTTNTEATTKGTTTGTETGTAGTETTAKNTTDNSTKTTTESTTTTATTENTTTVAEVKKEPITIPSAQTNVNYRVQISATHQNVEVSYFQGKYSISEQIYAEMHEGWNKFTVGAFNEYKLARDHREEVKNKGVAGPFVTAYNSGKRITVQEALMITSQKWYR